MTTLWSGKMKSQSVKACYLLAAVSLTFLTVSCSRGNEALELVKKSALELVKKSPYQPGSENTQTVAEWAQAQAAEGTNKNVEYKWVVEYKQKYQTYVVSYVDIDERGWFWEADLKKNTVRSITDSWLMKRKYEVSPMRHDGKFLLENVSHERVDLKDNSHPPGIAYALQAEIKNNSDHRITSARVSAKLVVIYGESKVIDQNGDDALLSGRISTENPWKPGESRKISIETIPYDKVYRDYAPEDAFCYVFVIVSDPIGFEYSGAIAQRNVKDMLIHLKELSPDR